MTVIDPSNTKSASTVALPRLTWAADVEDGPAGTARVRVVSEADPVGVVLGVDGESRTSQGDRPRLPAWEGAGGGDLVPGRTASWWSVPDVLVHHQGNAWTAFLNPSTRRRQVSLHRWGR